MTQTGDVLTDEQYREKLEFIKKNKRSGDIRDLAKITDLTQNYLYMILNGTKKSDYAVRVGEQLITHRREMLKAVKSMSLTNP